MRSSLGKSVYILPSFFLLSQVALPHLLPLTPHLLRSQQIEVSTSKLVLYYCISILDPNSLDTDGMLSQALLVGNFEAAVDICISADRMVSISFLG